MSHEQHPYQRNLQHRTDYFSTCMQYCFHLHLSFYIYRIDTIPYFLRFVKPLPQIFFEKAGLGSIPFFKVPTAFYSFSFFALFALGFHFLLDLLQAIG